MLAAAFTLGLVIAGHFSADLRNFEQVVDSAGRVAGARRSTTCCRTWRRSTSSSRSSTRSRSPPAYMALTAGYGVALHRALLLRAALIFSRRDFK